MKEDITECRECSELLDLLVDFLDGKASEQARAELMVHVHSCDHCARLLWSMRRVVVVCRSEIRTQVPSTIHERLWAVLREELTAGRADDADE